MSENFKEGASLWNKITITFQEIKDFAFDKYGAGMAHIDGWFVSMVLVFVLIPILLFSGVTTSNTVDFTPVHKKTRKDAVLYDYPTFGEKKKGTEARRGNPITTIKKGEELILLAYQRYLGCYQVETADGNRGYVPFDVISDSLVALKNCSYEAKRIKKGDELLLVNYKNSYDMSVKYEGTVCKGLNLDDVLPVDAFGMPVYIVSNPSPVTVNWVKSHIKRGETSKEDIDKEWFGYALTQKTAKDAVVASYPLCVQDADKGLVYKKFNITYRNGTVDVVTYNDAENMDWIMTKLPCVDAIQSSPLCVKYLANKITSPAKFNKIEDIKSEKTSSSIAKWIKENIGEFNMPSWLNSILGIVILIVGLLLAFLFIHCVLLMLPMLVQFTGYIYVLPNWAYRIMMTLAVLFGGELLYVFAGGVNWFLTIMLVLYLFWQLKQWNYWISFNRCSNCGHMYTLDTTNYRDGGTSYYDQVEYEVKKYGNVEIGRKEISRKHRKIVTVHEDLCCSNCGCDFTYTHNTDREA